MNLSTQRGLAHLAACSTVFAAMCAAIVLRIFPPSTSAFYPRCPIHLWLHIDCPGCGGTRALAALLQGQWVQALHLNPMVVLFLPFAVVYFAIAYWRAVRDQPFVWPAPPEFALKLCLVAIGVFTIARNFPTT